MTTHIVARAALVGAGALALLGPLTGGTAVAASTGGQESVHVMSAPYAVVPYEAVNVRTGPSRAFPAVGSVAAGEARGAYCWEFGEPVSDYGYTNNVWVKLAEGYVSAVYLKGDEYGGLPATASC
ncbi:SH3 domain-containing protein [Streptomyces sp. NPDC090106]|uniref:SH3 domain-containing protein n=1 Tax=Streptomyces sp. NPDC090106 TaxID=3365946 RepID=UPI0038066CB7